MTTRGYTLTIVALLASMIPVVMGSLWNLSEHERVSSEMIA